MAVTTNFSIDRELQEKENEDILEKALWWLMYIMPPIFGLIFLLGVIGNGSLIYIIGCKKMMRTIPNLLICNLALGDLLALVFTVPFISTIYTHDSWPFGEFICKASEFAKVTHFQPLF